MKRISVLGAGKSSPCLIQELLASSERLGVEILVADLDERLARARIAGHPRGIAASLDIENDEARRELIATSAIVISLLAPAFHLRVARDCVAAGVSLVTASYRDEKMRALDEAARERGVLILSEMGLDPGIDHMSAMDLLGRLRAEGAEISSFRSYGSGIADPDAPSNPLGYVVTWNPRNVVLAGQAGARYLEDRRIRCLPGSAVLQQTWPVHVAGIGTLEAYANRDSLAYRGIFELEAAETLIRGTLRRPGFCEVWSALGRLGLTNDTLEIPESRQRTFAEVVEMFLPSAKGSLRERTAIALHLNPTGHVLDCLEWLGIFSDRRPATRDGTAADMLTALIEDRLRLPEHGRDLVILQHEIAVRWPDGRLGRDAVVATLTARGDPGGITAMARTVGLPAALAALAIYEGRLTHTGSLIPTEPSLYGPILAALEARGLRFVERWTGRTAES